jgi:hypothetical protein
MTDRTPSTTVACLTAENSATPHTAICPPAPCPDRFADHACVRALARDVEELVAVYSICPTLPRTRALVEALRDECAEAVQAAQEERK